MSASEKDKIVLSLSSDVTVKEAPNLEQIAFKAIAGVSEQDLIERNTIATVEETGEQSNTIL